MKTIASIHEADVLRAILTSHGLPTDAPFIRPSRGPPEPDLPVPGHDAPAARRTADLRRGYNGLYALARNEMGHDPRSGDLFLFVNRKRTSTKILHHDGTGLCIYMKRLDKGRFAPLWRRDDDGRVRLTASELALYLEGCREVGYRRLAPPRTNTVDARIGP